MFENFLLVNSITRFVVRFVTRASDLGSQLHEVFGIRAAFGSQREHAPAEAGQVLHFRQQHAVFPESRVNHPAKRSADHVFFQRLFAKFIYFKFKKS